MVTMIYNSRVPIIDTEKTRDSVGSSILLEFEARFKASPKVYSDAVDYLSDKTLLFLLEVDVEEIERYLRRKYTERIFLEYVKAGQIDYNNYDRKRDDNVDKLTGLSIEYTKDMDLNQLEMVSRNPKGFTEDFDLYVEEEYPEVYEDKPKAYRKVTVYIDVIGTNLDHYITLAYRRLGKRKHIPWKGVWIDDVTMTSGNGKTKGVITLNVREDYSRKEVEDGIYKRLGLHSKKHPWYECTISDIKF